MMVIGLEIFIQGIGIYKYANGINMMVNGSKDLGMEREHLHLI